MPTTTILELRETVSNLLIGNILAETAPKFQPVSNDRVMIGKTKVFPLFSATGCAKISQGNNTQTSSNNVFVSLIWILY